MTRKAVLLGGGDPAKWVYEQISDQLPDLPIIGMDGERSWLEGKSNVIDFVRPADLRNIMRKLSSNGINSVSVFGMPFSSIGFQDVGKPTMVLLIAAASALATFRPSITFPNTFFFALTKYLRKRNIRLFNLGKLLGEINGAPGQVIGRSEIQNCEDLFSEAVIFRDRSRLSWRKHGVLMLRDGTRLLQISGTKTMLKTFHEQGFNLSGSVLVKAEVPEFKNLDTPVIDDELVLLCSKLDVRAIITDATAIVIDQKKIKKICDDSGICVHFI